MAAIPEVAQKLPDSVSGAPSWTTMDLGTTPPPIRAHESMPVQPVVVDAGEQFQVRSGRANRIASIRPPAS